MRGDVQRKFQFDLIFFDIPKHFPTFLAGDLRHRILPMSVLQHRPQEAAFVVSLLHPDPRARPSVDQILASNMLAILQRSLW